MRKIAILEVLDPAKNEFIPVRQAINQGLFNPLTYLFYNPIENKQYSITEAAQKGLFKSGIDLRPESLIVERVKVEQTVCLLSARDPTRDNKIISIIDAIEKGIVDTNLRLYRDPITNEVTQLSDAIENDLVQVKIVRETTEKVTETLTEQKSPDNFGLIKKVETSRTNEDHLKDFDDQENTDKQDIRVIDGLYVFDRTKSYNINKRMKKSDEEIAAGFITERDSNRILNQTNKNLRSILKTNQPRTLSPLIDFNEALKKNIIVLPDSLCLTQNVQHVLDLKNSKKLDFDTACDLEIIDIKNKKFFNTRTNTYIPLFEALEKNYIVMKEELTNNYEDADQRAFNQPPSKFNQPNRITEFDASAVFNPLTGQQIPIREAIELGIYDRHREKYIDPLSKKQMSLEDAVDKGLAVLKFKGDKTDEEYQFLHIKGIYNPITKKPMPMPEAINSGFLDYYESEFHDPVSGKTYTLLEAFDRGFLITNSKPFDSSIADFVHNDTNKKPKELETELQSRFKSYPSGNEVVKKEPPRPMVTSKSFTNDISLTNNTKNDVKLKRTQTNPDHVMKNRPSKIDDRSFDNSLLDASSIQMPTDPNSQIKNSTLRSEAKSHSPLRTSSISRSSRPRARSSSHDLKSLDSLSFMTRKSIMSKIKEKMFGKKSRSNKLTDDQMENCIEILNTLTNKKFKLEEAIKSDLLYPDDRIRDIKNNTSLSIKEAIQNNIILFHHPINHFQFKYGFSCYIFDDYLLLVNYVLNPDDHKKIGLKSAFNKQVIDVNNLIYNGKKGVYTLASAIEKGYISCEIVELEKINSLIMRYILQYYDGNSFKIPKTDNQEVVTTEPKNETIQEKFKDNPLIEFREDDFDITLDRPISPRQPPPPPPPQPLQPQLPVGLKKEDPDRTLNDSEPNYGESVLFDNEGYVSKKFLRDSEIPFNQNKNYTFSQAYDSGANRFISYKKAKEIGIVDEAKIEYIDAKTGDSLDFITAIKKNKIKLAEANKKKLLNSSFISDSHSLADNSTADLSLAKYTDLDSSFEAQNNTVTKSNSYNVLSDSKVEKPFPSKSSTFIDFNTTTKNTKYNNTENLNDTLYELSSSPGYSYGDSNNDVNSKNTTDDNIIKCLLYKKPSNGKYIRFDRVIKLNLYNKETGKIMDQSTREYYTLHEALQIGLIRVNDSNVLHDDSKFYIINTILVANQKLTLFDSIAKKIIDKANCIYTYQSDSYSIKDAMKQGFIEGKIITFHEVTWLLDDYHQKIMSKLAEQDGHDLSKIDDSTLISNDFIITPPVEVPQQNKIINEFYVFDSEMEMYISVSEALKNGTVLSDPIRIRDPNTNTYILVKDAAIKGLISCEQSEEKISLKDRSSFFTLNRVSYIIDAILDPIKQTRYSLQKATNKGLFINGIYKDNSRNIFYHIDEAISQGLVIGKRVDLDQIDISLSRSLGLGPVSSPRKPENNIYNKRINNKAVSSKNLYDTNRTASKKKMFNSEESILRSSIEPFNGKITTVKDVSTNRFVKPDEAEKLGIINFFDGIFKNSLTNEILRINEAVNLGFIQVQKQDSKLEYAKSANFIDETRRPMRRSSFSTDFDDDDISNWNKMQIGPQFTILSVLDPVKQTRVTLEEAIDKGILDLPGFLYINRKNNKKCSLIDAIDNGFIKIQDNFIPSYKLVTQDDKSPIKHIKTVSIRFVINSDNNLIPYNTAVTQRLVDPDDGTLSYNDSAISFKSAYDTFLAFTADDLDNPISNRYKFSVRYARKSTTGKKMSNKSALAKNWLNIDRRVYIDKQTNQEMPFSQAIDLGFLVLFIDNSKSTKELNKDSLDFTLDNNDSKQNSVKNSSFTRSKSRDSYQSKDSYQAAFSSRVKSSSKNRK